MKRKHDIVPGSRKKRINVSVSEKLLEDTKDVNRSEALEEAYWLMQADINKGSIIKCGYG